MRTFAVFDRTARIEIRQPYSKGTWSGLVDGVPTTIHREGLNPRMGLSHSSIAPYDGFPTRDGQMLIGVQNDRGWRTLVTEVLGVPALGDDPRFVTNVQRVRNRAACDAALAAETERWSTDELADRLAAAGVPAAQIRDLDAVVDHPQLAARERWRTIGTEHAPAQALLPPITFADVEAPMGDVPALGRHTEALLVESGLDAETAQDLIGRGVAMQAESFHPARPSS